MRIVLACIVWLPLVFYQGNSHGPRPPGPGGPFPMCGELAQEFTWTEVGTERLLICLETGEPIGRVIVMGLQTTLIRDFYYNGPFPGSIALGKGGEAQYELWSITHPQWDSFTLLCHPAKFRYETADTIMLCVGGEAVATTGAFPPPWGY